MFAEKKESKENYLLITNFGTLIMFDSTLYQNSLIFNSHNIEISKYFLKYQEGLAEIIYSQSINIQF